MTILGRMLYLFFHDTIGVFPFNFQIALSLYGFYSAEVADLIQAFVTNNRLPNFIYLSAHHIPSSFLLADSDCMNCALLINGW